MKIVAPIRQLDEIAALARAGADELYCGVTPREWAERFGGASANRRPGGNLPSLAALAEAVELAHHNGVQLSLVLNAQQYSVEQIEFALEIARGYADMGGDAVIASEIVSRSRISPTMITSGSSRSAPRRAAANDSVWVCTSR